MKIDYMLDEGAFAPERAHEWDAGFDLRTPHMISIKSGSMVKVDTGVHFQFRNAVGMVKSKSGLNARGIQCEGVIDAGYTGPVMAVLYNHGERTITFMPGDKITQIVFIELPKIEMNKVDSLHETERGDGGFGSSGR